MFCVNIINDVPLSVFFSPKDVSGLAVEGQYLEMAVETDNCLKSR